MFSFIRNRGSLISILVMWEAGCSSVLDLLAGGYSRLTEPWRYVDMALRFETSCLPMVLPSSAIEHHVFSWLGLLSAVFVCDSLWAPTTYQAELAADVCTHTAEESVDMYRILNEDRCYCKSGRGCSVVLILH